MNIHHTPFILESFDNLNLAFLRYYTSFPIQVHLVFQAIKVVLWFFLFLGKAYSSVTKWLTPACSDGNQTHRSRKVENGHKNQICSYHWGKSFYLSTFSGQSEKKVTDHFDSYQSTLCCLWYRLTISGLLLKPHLL